jgi:hypothetical protein
VAVSASDVSGLPGSPLMSGTVLFVALARAADVAAMASVEPGNASQLAHASFVVDRAGATALGATAVAIGADGRFPVAVPDGRYLVCLADIFADHTAGPPYSVVGCAEVTLPAAPAAGLTVSFGEGGVEARLS